MRAEAAPRRRKRRIDRDGALERAHGDQQARPPGSCSTSCGRPVPGTLRPPPGASDNATRSARSTRAAHTRWPRWPPARPAAGTGRTHAARIHRLLRGPRAHVDDADAQLRAPGRALDDAFDHVARPRGRPIRQGAVALDGRHLARAARRGTASRRAIHGVGQPEPKCVSVLSVENDVENTAMIGQAGSWTSSTASASAAGPGIKPDIRPIIASASVAAATIHQGIPAARRHGHRHRLGHDGRCRRFFGDSRDQAIADPRHRFDELLRSIRTERAAQRRHIDGQVALFDDGVGPKRPARFPCRPASSCLNQRNGVFAPPSA